MSNFILSLLIVVCSAFWIYAFYLSFKHFRLKKFPAVYDVREYSEGKLINQYKEISGYKEIVPTPPILCTDTSGVIKEDPVTALLTSQDPQLCNSKGRPKGSKNKPKEEDLPDLEKDTIDDLELIYEDDDVQYL